MNRQLAHLLEKLARHRDASVSEQASKALHYATESTRARLALRSCDEVGIGARSRGQPIVKNRGEIRIGKELWLNCRWSPVELASAPGAKLTLGNNVTINYGTLISATRSVMIGSGVMIGNHCIIADSDAPGTVDRAPLEGANGASSRNEPRPIEIGDGVWLAVRVTVLPGVKIGANAVITAGSVVAGDIPPGVIAGGIPARVLRAAASATGADKTSSKALETNATPPLSLNGASKPRASAEPALPREVTHRGILISDFTVDDLAEQFRRLPGAPGIEASVAPFGQVVQMLMQGSSPDDADFAVIWTRAESMVPTFSRVVAFERPSDEDLLAEVDQFCDLVLKARERYRSVFVPTWTMPAYDRGLGLIDTREGGAARALALMNLRLMDRLAKGPNVHVLDAQRWLHGVGRSAYSPKLWHLGKVPFHPDVFAEAARDVQAGLGALGGGARKLLVLDLDDTLWGGVVGDAGWENLRLGGHDGLGEAFVDFQRTVKNLTRRGIVLGIVSKNEEATALEAIRKHPEMLLREDDFVGWRINWRDKAQNILELAKELNLGLQSVVFIDDNPVERARVREALPEVLVPEWPEDKHFYSSALLSLRCFDTPSLSREDAARTELYSAERRREKLQTSVGSMDEWLKSLDMTVHAEPLAPHNLQRATQLLNKTNQMNLSTRRLTEEELTQWVEGPGRRLWTVSVADRFGDAGLTGIVSLETQGQDGRIVDFVLSCRVMGRKVEHTMAHLAVESARSLGVERVEARLLPTSKNQPCASFWEASGFICADTDLFVWDARQPYALPESIRLEWRR